MSEGQRLQKNEVVNEERRKICDPGNRESKLESKREFPQMVKRNHKMTAIQQIQWQPSQEEEEDRGHQEKEKKDS